MDPWQIWVAVALLFIVLEIFTAGFAVACFSFGAVASAVACLFDLSLIWQLVLFAVVSILALIFIRPLVLKLFFKNKQDQVTNVDAIIGRKGRVSEKIDSQSGKGRVALDGDDWKAVSEDGGTIEKGEAVTIVGRSGVIITVKKD